MTTRNDFMPVTSREPMKSWDYTDSLQRLNKDATSIINNATRNIYLGIYDPPHDRLLETLILREDSIQNQKQLRPSHTVQSEQNSSEQRHYSSNVPRELKLSHDQDLRKHITPHPSNSTIRTGDLSLPSASFALTEPLEQSLNLPSKYTQTRDNIQPLSDRVVMDPESMAKTQVSAPSRQNGNPSFSNSDSFVSVNDPSHPDHEYIMTLKKEMQQNSIKPQAQSSSDLLNMPSHLPPAVSGLSNYHRPYSPHFSFVPFSNLQDDILLQSHPSSSSTLVNSTDAPHFSPSSLDEVSKQRQLLTPLTQDITHHTAPTSSVGSDAALSIRSPYGFAPSATICGCQLYRTKDFAGCICSSECVSCLSDPSFIVSANRLCGCYDAYSLEAKEKAIKGEECLCSCSRGCLEEALRERYHKEQLLRLHKQRCVEREIPASIYRPVPYLRREHFNKSEQKAKIELQKTLHALKYDNQKKKECQVTKPIQFNRIKGSRITPFPSPRLQLQTPLEPFLANQTLPTARQPNSLIDLAQTSYGKATRGIKKPESQYIPIRDWEKPSKYSSSSFRTSVKKPFQGPSLVSHTLPHSSAHSTPNSFTPNLTEEDLQAYEVLLQPIQRRDLV